MDSWGCLPVHSASTPVRNHNWHYIKTDQFSHYWSKATVKYLPIRSQRSSSSLLWLELWWIIFFFVILKEIKSVNSGSMPDCTIHKSYLWVNHFIVSNVDVDNFSRGTCRRVLSMNLQQAVCELQEVKVTKDAIIYGLSRPDQNSRCPLPPCHSYATSQWWD